MARFMRKGTTKVYFLTTLPAPAAPTTAQITAGTALTDQISEINGFTYANSPIDTPDMGNAFVTKISGEDTVENSSIVFYEDKLTNPISTALAKGVNGFILIFPTGIAGANPAAGDKSESWPVQIASNARQYQAGNEAARYTVSFANTGAPVAGTVV